MIITQEHVLLYRAIDLCHDLTWISKDILKTIHVPFDPKIRWNLPFTWSNVEAKSRKFRGVFNVKSRVKSRKVREILSQQLEHKQGKYGKTQFLIRSWSFFLQNLVIVTNVKEMATNMDATFYKLKWFIVSTIREFRVLNPHHRSFVKNDRKTEISH